jgi:ATP-binding cassette subfamily B protein
VSAAGNVGQRRDARARTAPEQTQRERRLVERWTSIYPRFNEVLAGIVTVKSFAMEEQEHRGATS